MSVLHASYVGVVATPVYTSICVAPISDICIGTCKSHVELVADDFTVAYKEGKCESADQTALLTTCIERVAERVRNNELPPVVETGAKTAAAEEDEDQNAGDESGAHADESAMGTSTVDAAPAQAAASEAPETADTNVTSIKEEPMAAEAQSEAPAATDEPIAETAESADQPAEPQSAGQT